MFKIIAEFYSMFINNYTGIGLLVFGIDNMPFISFENKALFKIHL